MNRIDEGLKRRVALKWANGEQLTLSEAHVWADMLKTPPVVSTPSPDELAVWKNEVITIASAYQSADRKSVV